MAQRYHKSKEIHEVIDAAVRSGRWRWVRKKNRNHEQGELLCPHSEPGGSVVRVASTPRNPEGHARKIQRLLDRCPHSVPKENDASG